LRGENNGFYYHYRSFAAKYEENHQNQIFKKITLVSRSLQNGQISNFHPLWRGEFLTSADKIYIFEVTTGPTLNLIFFRIFGHKHAWKFPCESNEFCIQRQHQQSAGA
jgi:hypothetical protein